MEIRPIYLPCSLLIAFSLRKTESRCRLGTTGIDYGGCRGAFLHTRRRGSSSSIDEKLPSLRVDCIYVIAIGRTANRVKSQDLGFINSPEASKNKNHLQLKASTRDDMDAVRDSHMD